MHFYLTPCSQPLAFAVTGVMHDVNWVAWHELVALRSSNLVRSAYSSDHCLASGMQGCWLFALIA